MKKKPRFFRGYKPQLRSMFCACRAVSFDAAGTLIVSRPDLPEALMAACRGLGLRVTREDAGALYNAVRSRFTQELLKAAGEGRELSAAEKMASWKRAFVEDPHCPVSDKRGMKMLEEEFLRIRFRWSAAPDALRLLRSLRESGRLTCVVSNFDGSLPSVLGEVGLRGYLDAIVASAEVHLEKPDPRIFSVALERLSVAPDEAIHVGDDALDVVGANRAGMKSVWLVGATHASPLPDGVKPTAAISRLADLLPMLGLEAPITG